jgi:hypothetical protein
MAEYITLQDGSGQITLQDSSGQVLLQSGASTRGQVSWVELEVPNASTPTRGRVSFAELEVPFVATRGRVSFAELEVPTVQTRGRVSFAEFEVPSVLTRGRVSFAELEVPDPPTPTRGRVSFAELEVPSIATRGRVSWIEFEVPNIGGGDGTTWVGSWQVGVLGTFFRAYLANYRGTPTYFTSEKTLLETAAREAIEAFDAGEPYPQLRPVVSQWFLDYLKRNGG